MIARDKIFDLAARLTAKSGCIKEVNHPYAA
jgi:hypothetical protein